MLDETMYESRDATPWYQSQDREWELAPAQYGEMSDAEINYRAELETERETLTERQAAELLGVTVTHVRRLVGRGTLRRRDGAPEIAGTRGRPAIPALCRAEVERYARERRPRGRPGKGASGGD